MEVHTDIEEQDSEVGVEDVAGNVVVEAVDHCIDQALGGFRRFGTFLRLVDTPRTSFIPAHSGEEGDEEGVSCRFQIGTAVSIQTGPLTFLDLRLSSSFVWCLLGPTTVTRTVSS
jgi:hypothetical protein